LSYGRLPQCGGITIAGQRPKHELGYRPRGDRGQPLRTTG